MKETRKARFIRLAEKRTNAALDRIRVLGNLSNRSNYEYDEYQVRKIFNIIESELKKAKASFSFIKKNKFRL